MREEEEEEEEEREREREREREHRCFNAFHTPQNTQDLKRKTEGCVVLTAYVKKKHIQ